MFLAQSFSEPFWRFCTKTVSWRAFAALAQMMLQSKQNTRFEAMSEYLLLILGTALVNNVVLVKFWLCPFMGVSNKLDTALGMGLATTFVLTLASAAS